MRPLPTALLAVSLTALFVPAASYARSPAPAAASAGSAATPQPDDEVKKFEAAVSKLGLSAEQKPKFASLIKEVKASLKKIDGTSDAPIVKQQKIMKLRNEAKEKLDHILTVAQDRELKQLLDSAKKPTGLPKK